MRTLAAALVAALLVLTGCETDASGGSGSAIEDTGKTADLGFEATTLVGDTFEGETLAGKPAVLWFWAPWCPTCRAQIPNLTELADRHGEEVAFVGVGGLSDEASIEETAGTIEHLTHVVDPEGTVWQHFGVTAQSTYTVIDADGRIVSEGYLDDGELNDLVDSLAAEA